MYVVQQKKILQNKKQKMINVSYLLKLINQSPVNKPPWKMKKI